MKLFSSSTSSNPSNLTILSPTQTPTPPSRFHIPVPFKPIHTKTHLHTLSAHDSSSSLQDNQTSSEPFMEDKDKLNEEIRATRQSLEELLVVRRPVMDSLGEDDEENMSSIDTSLSKFAKKMTFFEPGRVESREKPLVVNLDLALYKSKVLGRNFRYQEAEELLQKV